MLYTMNKIEHIGIAVKSLSTSIPKYELMLDTPCYKIEEVPSQKVRTAFFKLGDNKIELLEPTSEDSVIHRFIEKNGEGMHHVAYAVEDIFASIARLRKDGFQILNENPSEGADNKLVSFIHPRDCAGVLTELCQDIS